MNTEQLYLLKCLTLTLNISSFKLYVSIDHKIDLCRYKKYLLQIFANDLLNPFFFLYLDHEFKIKNETTQVT